MENSTKPALPSLAEVQEGFHNFGIIDYIVFSCMLVGCSFIGVFYALHTKSKKGTDEATEYLMGGKQLGLFPISMSLVASFISGISLLGTPSEIYLHGISYLYCTIAIVIAGYISAEFFIPVFFNLQLSSTYEYLYLRFDNKVRLFGSILFALGLSAWLPIVIYVPALAFNQVTGVNVHIVTPIVCIVCIFYTCVGGMKAVVWTDVVQTFLMIGALFTVMVLSTINAGGLGAVLSKNWEGGRIEGMSLSANPTIRHSVFSMIFAATFHEIQSAYINQNMIQRFLSLPTLKDAKASLWIYTFGANAFILSCGYLGLAAYATYENCDPLTTGLAKAKDQVLPLLVMKTAKNIPGLPGLFIAGVFSASLSSLSTGLNSMSAVALEDFIKPFCKTPPSEKATRLILRGIVLAYGAICVSLVFIVERLGQVLLLSIGLSSVSLGASLGIFLCGMFMPWINSKGAFYGGIIGMVSSAVIVFGQQKAQVSGAITIANKVLSVAGCDYTFGQSSVMDFSNSTIGDVTPVEEPFALFRLSYFTFTMIGTLITILFACIISYSTGNNDILEKDLNLYTPMVKTWLEKRKKQAAEEKKLLESLSNKPVT